MTNRRDDEAYGRPDRNGVVAAWALIALAILVGVFVLSKIGKSSPQSASSSESSVAVPAEDTIPPADPNAAPTTTTPSAVVPAARTPASVRVLVTNGSGVNKAAKKVSDAIGVQQYQMVPPRDASASNFADAVFFAPGFEAEAQAIAASLGQVDAIQADGTTIQQLATIAALPDASTVRTPPAVPPFDIQVMVGPGLAKRFQNAPAA